MLKFNTWPPEAGEVEFTFDGTQRVTKSPEIAEALGEVAASVVISNSNLLNAHRTIGQLVDSNANLSNIEYFSGGAFGCINRYPEAQYVLGKAEGSRHV